MQSRTLLGSVKVSVDWNLSGQKGKVQAEGPSDCRIVVLSNLGRIAEGKGKVQTEFDNTLSEVDVIAVCGKQTAFSPFMNPSYAEVKQTGDIVAVRNRGNVPLTLFLRQSYDVYLGTVDPGDELSFSIREIAERLKLVGDSAVLFGYFQYKDINLFTYMLEIPIVRQGELRLDTGLYSLDVLLTTRSVTGSRKRSFGGQFIENVSKSAVILRLFDGQQYVNALIPPKQKVQTQYLGASVGEVELVSPAIPLLSKAGGRYSADLFGGALPNPPELVFTGESGELMRVPLPDADSLSNADQIVRSSLSTATQNSKSGSRLVGVSLCTDYACSQTYIERPPENWGEWSGLKRSWRRKVKYALIDPWQKEAFRTDLEGLSDKIEVQRFAVVDDGLTAGIVYNPKTFGTSGAGRLTDGVHPLPPGEHTVPPNTVLLVQNASDMRVVYVLRQEGEVRVLYGALDKRLKSQVLVPLTAEVGGEQYPVLGVIVSMKDSKGLLSEYVLRPALQLISYSWTDPYTIQLQFSDTPSVPVYVCNDYDNECKRITQAGFTAQFSNPVIAVYFRSPVPIVYRGRRIWYLSRFSQSLLKGATISFPNLVLNCDESVLLKGADVLLLVRRFAQQYTVPLGRHDVSGQLTLNIADAVRDADAVEGVLVVTRYGTLRTPVGLTVDRPKVIVSRSGITVQSSTWQSVAEVVIKHCSGEVRTHIGSTVPFEQIDVSCARPPVLTVVTPSGEPVLLANGEYSMYLYDLLPQTYVQYDAGKNRWIVSVSLSDVLKQIADRIEVQRLEGRQWQTIYVVSNKAQILSGTVVAELPPKKPGQYRVVVVVGQKQIPSGTFYILPILKFERGRVCIEGVETRDSRVEVLTLDGERQIDAQKTHELQATGCFSIDRPGRYFITTDSLSVPIDVYGIAKVWDRVLLWDSRPHFVKCVFGCSGEVSGTVAELPAVPLLPAVLKVDGQLKILGKKGLLLFAVLGGGVVGAGVSYLVQKQKNQTSQSEG